MEALKFDDFGEHGLKESILIGRILAGEKELYEILVRRNNQRLYRVMRTYLKEDAEIQDVMQETYLKAYTKLHQFRLDASFSTWLIRIGINEALARLREKGRVYPIQPFPDAVAQSFVMNIPDGDQPDPQQRLMRKETRLVLERAIDHLDLKYRTVYIMREVEEMELKEIALALDITLANVKVRLHRSKEMLKERLYRMSVNREVYEFGYGSCDRLTYKVMESLR